MLRITTLTRALVATPFVVAGLETLRDPGPRAERIAPVVKPLADRLSWFPSSDPETLVRIQAALGLGTGTLFVLGRFQRLTALLLAAQLVPALLTEHRFWAERNDPRRRADERTHMVNNAGLFGTLLMLGTAARKRHPQKAVPRPARAGRLATGGRARHVRQKAAASSRT